MEKSIRKEITIIEGKTLPVITLDKDEIYNHLILTKKGDIRAYRALSGAYIPYIEFVLYAYANSGLNYIDIMADCYDGLGKAIEDFELDSNVDFSEFVLNCMEQQIISRFKSDNEEVISINQYYKLYRNLPDYDANPEERIIDLETKPKISPSQVYDELVLKEELVMKIMFRDDKVLSYRETAKLAGIPVKEVKEIFKMVRKKLQEYNEQMSKNNKVSALTKKDR